MIPQNATIITLNSVCFSRKTSGSENTLTRHEEGNEGGNAWELANEVSGVCLTLARQSRKVLPLCLSMCQWTETAQFHSVYLSMNGENLRVKLWVVSILFIYLVI